MKNNCWLLFLCSNIIGHMILCRPLKKDAEIIMYKTSLPEYDTYHFSYKTENLNRVETGYVNRNKSEGATIKVHGYYTFIDPEGRGHLTKFVADKNGYRSKFTFNSGISLFRPEPGVQVEPIGTAVLATLTGGGIG